MTDAPLLHAAETAGPMWVYLAAGIPSAASAAWVAIKFLSDRRDKAIDRSGTYEERRAKQLADERAALSVAQQEQWDRLQADRDRGWSEADRAWTIVKSLRTDLDRVWNIARFWHGEYSGLVRLARNTIHDLANQRQITLDLLKRHCAGQPPPEWEPLPDMPRVPGGVDDPRANPP